MGTLFSEITMTMSMRQDLGIVLRYCFLDFYLKIMLCELFIIK